MVKMEILNVQSLAGIETVGTWKTFLGWCWNDVYVIDITALNNQKCTNLNMKQFFEISMHPPFIGKKGLLSEWHFPLLF